MRKSRIYRDEKGKECSACKQYFAWDEFNFCKSKPDGHAYICKKCLRIEGLSPKVKAYKLFCNRRHGVKAFVPVVRDGLGKECSCCKIKKPWADFQKLKSSPDGHQYQCKPCSSLKAKKYRSSPRGKETTKKWKKTDKGLECRSRYVAGDAAHTAQEKWRKSPGGKARAVRYIHRKRAQKSGQSYQSWLAGIKSQKTFVCYWCKKTFLVTGKNLHVDHIVPIALGGIDGAENVCASCSVCNHRKSDKSLEQWAAEIGALAI